MDSSTRRDPVTVATSLVCSFYRMLDERDYDGLAAAMHPDGAWHRKGAAPFAGLFNTRTIRATAVETPQGWRLIHVGGDPVSFEAA